MIVWVEWPPDGTGSESSGSDEASMPFDVWCCSPSHMEEIDGRADSTSWDLWQTERFASNSVLFSFWLRSRIVKQDCNISVRAANHMEANISAIYERIARRTTARISL